MEVRIVNLLAHHTVEDYSKRKPFFNGNSGFRSQIGYKDGKVFRSVNNLNDLFILFEWDYAENARKFSESDNLKEVMQKAGVQGNPDIYFV